MAGREVAVDALVDQRVVRIGSTVRIGAQAHSGATRASPRPMTVQCAAGNATAMASVGQATLGDSSLATRFSSAGVTPCAKLTLFMSLGP